MTHRQGVALGGESVGRHPLLDGDLRLDSRLTPCDDGFEPVREDDGAVVMRAALSAATS